MTMLLTILAAALATSAPGEGRTLYQFGVTDSPVLMSLPGDAAFASGSAMACAACHGSSGNGTAERVSLPALALVAATAADAERFARALGQGIASDGHAMRLMPRYAMSPAQRQSLASYLIALEAGSPHEPGVSNSAIIIDIRALADGPRRALLSYAGEHPSSIYGRLVRFSSASEAAPFARIAPAAPASLSPQDTPVLVIASESPGAGRAAVLVMTELLRRSGRRLTQHGFAEALEDLSKQEIKP